MQFLLKTLLSALIISGVSELAKRSTWIAAIIASLPLTSILALSWLYWDTGDEQKISALSWGILWATIPSFLFFIALPLLIKSGVRFPGAILLSSLIMFIGYTGYVWIFSINPK